MTGYVCRLENLSFIVITLRSLIFFFSSESTVLGLRKSVGLQYRQWNRNPTVVVNILKNFLKIKIHSVLQQDVNSENTCS
jgi:hypothetical protein